MQSHIVKSFDSETDGLKKKIIELAKNCEQQLSKAIDAFVAMDVDLANAVIAHDEYINHLQRDIEEDAVLFLARRQPMALDLRHLLSVMKIAGELERIADYAANFSKRVSHLKMPPTQEPSDLIVEMAKTCQLMIHDAMDAFLRLDVKKAVAVWHKDDDIDTMFARMVTLVQKQMQENKFDIKDGTGLILMGRCCERIGDHITNMAEDIYFIKTGKTYSGDFEDCYSS
ncbi:MAG: phosphate signaling complex protein PhoU [Desulfobacula sp.]|nr:phosphate signaling complex protein PhoU [Desulfobacula sp.]